MRRAVAAVGLCSWDRFLVLDHQPVQGGFATVQRQFEQAGGTTANTCAALGRLGVDVALASGVGDDDEGAALVDSLSEAGCDVTMIERDPESPTDSCLILIPDDDTPRDRTILWVKGAQPRHGDRLPINELLDHRWLLIDVNDDRLRSFLLELPAHLSPRTLLLGVMTYLTDTSREVGWEHLLAHDIVFGNQFELIELSGAHNLTGAIDIAQKTMRHSACRVMYVSLGADGAIAIRSDGTVTSPAFDVEVVDTTGAGDAFTAGCIWGIVEGLSDEEVLRRGNAVGARCCTGYGARAALPDREDVLKLIERGQ